MNKNKYLIAAISGFVCVAAAIIAWAVFYALLNSFTGNEEGNTGLGLAIVTAIFAVPLTICDGAFAAVIAGLSAGALSLIKKDRVNKALLITLGVFEFLTAASFAFMCFCTFKFIVAAVLFAIAFLLYCAVGIVSIVLATKLKTPEA